MGRKYEMLIRARGDSNDAIRAMRQLQGELIGMGEKMRNVGSKMSRDLTLPTLIAGGAAIKLDADFQQSMTNIEALVGTSHRQVQAWSKEILAMSGQLPQGPKELGDALYFVASSGFKGASAMRVLKASAKAAATGLGETETVADAVTSAVSSYGEKNLSASRAADALVAAVREGKGEASDFAASIGRVIPVSAQLGVSFQEVTGAVAAMTRGGLDAAEATTALRQILHLIMHPAKGAADALDKAGISVDVLRKTLREKGLLAGLTQMKEGLHGNIGVIGDAIPNIRAMSGFLNLTGKNSAAVAKVMQAVSNSTGDMDRAFRKASKSPMFKLKQGLSALKKDLIEIGAVMMPTVLKIVDGFKKMSDRFRKISPETKKLIVTVALLAAALGPVLMITGNMMIAFGEMLPMLVRAKGAFTVYGSGVLLAGFALHSMGVKLSDVTGFIKDHSQALKAIIIGLASYKAVVMATMVVQSEFAAFFAASKLVSFFYTISSGTRIVAALRAQMLLLDAAMVANPIGAIAVAAGATFGALMALSSAFGKAGQTARGMALDSKGAEKAIRGVHNATLAMNDQTFATTDSYFRLKDAQKGVADAMRQTHSRNSPQTVRAMHELAQATSQYRAELNKLHGGFSKAESKVASLRSRFRAGKNAIDETKASIAASRKEAEKFPNGSNWNKFYTKQADDAEKQLSRMRGNQNKLRGQLKSADADLKRSVSELARSMGIPKAKALEMLSGVSRTVKKIPGIAQGVVGPTNVQFQSVGAAMSDGITFGMLQQEPTITTNIVQMINRAKKTAKHAAEIKSPSKVFAREVGFPIAQGIAAGILRGSKVVNESAESILDNLREKMKKSPNNRRLRAEFRRILADVRLVARVQSQLQNMSSSFGMRRSYANLLNVLHGEDKPADIKRLMALDLSQFKRLRAYLRGHRRSLTMQQKTSLMDEMAGLVSDYRSLQESLRNPTSATSGGGMGSTGPVVINQHFTSEPNMFVASQSAAWAYRAAIMRVS